MGYIMKQYVHEQKVLHRTAWRTIICGKFYNYVENVINICFSDLYE